MRFRPVLTALAAATMALSISPAHADETIDFDDPAVYHGYNDGEVGVVELGFLPDVQHRSHQGRPMEARCKFVVEASVTGVITVDLVATSVASAYVNAGVVISPAGTAVTCKITLANGATETIAAAAPGASASAHGRFSFNPFQTPITVCARPNALWSDNVHQVSSREWCETSPG